MVSKKFIGDLITRYYRREKLGQRALEEAISSALEEGHSSALDAGCGIDAPLTRKFLNQASVVGLDVLQSLPGDLPVICGDLEHLPVRDGTFSLVFSRSVFEHLLRPERVLDEFHRILQPGGICIILTPSRYDYTSLVARFTPQAFHRWFVRKVYSSTAYDTFPTVYRANTPGYYRSIVRDRGKWRLRRLSGLRHYPVNLSFSRLLFQMGVLYDWAIARAGLTTLQPSLLVVLEKTENSL